ncbi:hypothetical protein HY212_01475 [Candidatus Pacearchaeota archaeon]|nr:hypothetical protein [Candidatus Pacearchaeota archaeon]
MVEVTSGDLKGSKITTILQKTWGFDGTSDGGTIEYGYDVANFGHVISVFPIHTRPSNIVKSRCGSTSSHHMQKANQKHCQH